MGRLAKILSFVRAIRRGVKVSDVKADPGGGANITAEHFSDSGDDAHPLPGDYLVIVGASGTGRETAVGYLDPKNDSKAQPGEKRIYARDPSTGGSVVEIWLKSSGEAIISNANGSAQLNPDGSTVITTPESTFNCAADGSISGANAPGSFELQAGGDFVVNGVTIDTNGNIDSPSSITSPSMVVDGKELANHDHGAGSYTAGATPVTGTSGGNN